MKTRERKHLPLIIILLLLTALSSSATPATSPILIVQGTRSVPLLSERATAKHVTARLSRWLSASGIAHEVITDDQVDNATLETASVVILGYNPKLPDDERGALIRFITQGGKLIVFYGDDAKLATAMGLELGVYQKQAAVGAYSSFTFRDAPFWPGTNTISQASWNIRPVYPAASNTHVLAYWEDLEGRTSAAPAWVASPHGLWMSHIALGDDARGKQALLEHILTYYVPSMKPAVALAKLDGATKIGSAKHLLEAVDLFEAAGLKGAVDAIGADYRESLNAYERGAYSEAIQASDRLSQTLLQSYALAQSTLQEAPPSTERRAVWDQRGVGLVPGN